MRAQLIYILAAAFDIYHALKIGFRGLVDDAIASRRFADISHHSRVLARDHGNRMRARERSDSHESDRLSLADNFEV